MRRSLAASSLFVMVLCGGICSRTVHGGDVKLMKMRIVDSHHETNAEQVLGPQLGPGRLCSA